ncbi:MAG TPA: hypothetical protein PLH19_07050 [Anaerolineae bacterium]|nr:hypothetical protein [Anaerolineae bacterium]HQH38279.1 hypothetical protein [Anaerolineae bacterium]
MSRKITQTLNREWEEIVSAIPDDLEASAKELVPFSVIVVCKRPPTCCGSF